MTLEGTLFDHYRLLTRIGKGGMGEVYLAEDTQIRRQVAAKLIIIETVQADQQAVSRALRFFRREATAIAKLDHPSILPLYDYGETEIGNMHVAYLICPYCPEASLVTWLRKRAQTQQLTLKQVAHVIQQASQGVQYAHDRAVMHLDVKPANFLIRSRATADEYPEVLLSDFGIARLASATASISQHISGTPTYMAPEQWANKPVFASDQYALAIMAYELLTGSPPFQGPPMSVMFAHIHELPEPIHRRNPLLPAAVDLVLQRALAKKPEERFPSVSSFAQDFQQASQEMPEESTLRLLRPSLPTSAMPDAPSGQAPVSNDKAAPSSNTQLAHPFPVPVVAPVQEKITLPSMSTASTANISASRPSLGPEQAAITSPSVVTQPPPLGVPVRPKWRRLPILVRVLLLLIIVLVTGGGIGVWRAATPQTHHSATAQANRGATAQANHTPTPSPTRAPAGTITAFPAPTSASEPQGITAGPDGNLWFTEWGGNKIGRISPSGSIAQFPVPISAGQLFGITAGPDNNLWFTEEYDNTIGRITSGK